MGVIKFIQRLVGLILLLYWKTDQVSPIITTRNSGPEQSLCNVWGDPHILMFPQLLSGPRPQQWCSAEGEYLIYQNKFVRFGITVVKVPMWKEQFSFTFFNAGAPLCVFDSCGRTCNSTLINIITMGSTIYITYASASLRIIIIRYTDSPFYDIDLIQNNFTIVGQSRGLCVNSSSTCQSERSSLLRTSEPLILEVKNPSNENRIVNKHAKDICNLYLQVAQQLSSQLQLPTIDYMIEELSLASCINDLESTGDKRFAKSIIQLLLINTITTWDMENEKAESYLKKINEALIPAIANASKAVDELLSNWII